MEIDDPNTNELDKSQEEENDAELELETGQVSPELESEEEEEIVEDLSALSSEEVTDKPILSRSQRRIQQEIGRRKAIEQELENARRQNVELNNRFAQQYDPAERQRQLDQMDPDQRLNYLLEEKDREFKSQLGRLEYMMVNQSDYSSFQSYLTANPEYKRLEQTVNNLFNEAIQKGQPQSRNAILSWVIGEEARAKKTNALAKAKKVGDDNIRKVTTRPITGRSNISGGGIKKTAEQTLFSNLNKGAYNL